MRAVLNTRRVGALESSPAAPLDFHRQLPGYAATRLVGAAGPATTLGLRHLWVKDEASRLGLPAFKILGASWAVARVVGETDPTRLSEAARRLGVGRLVAATDGNHGRAVAHVAKQIGLAATIFVPFEMVAARRDAIQSTGAQLVVVHGDYDEAVRRSTAEAADPAVRVVNDADQDGLSPIPGWVIEGYSTLFWEIGEQLRGLGVHADLLVVQIGVGALAAAGVRWACAAGVHVVGAEPSGAACVAASLAAGRVVSVPGTGTIMAGLDCPTPSSAAWPSLLAGLAGVVVVEDAEADDAARRLARAGIEAGESGAAGMAGLVALATDPACAALREAVGWGRIRSALVVNTEGATDPVRYARVVPDP